MKVKKIYVPEVNDIQMAKVIWKSNTFDKILLWFSAIFSFVVATMTLMDAEPAFGVVIFYAVAGGWMTRILVYVSKNDYILSNWWEKTGYVYSIILAILFVFGISAGLIDALWFS